MTVRQQLTLEIGPSAVGLHQVWPSHCLVLKKVIVLFAHFWKTNGVEQRPKIAV